MSFNPQPAGAGGTANLPELVTSYEYDHRGNLLQVTYAQEKLDETGKITESWEYDDTFSQITKHIDPLGRVTDFTIDPEDGNILQVIERDTQGDAGGDRATRFEYTSVDDPELIPGGMVKSTTVGLRLTSGGATPQDPSDDVYDESDAVTTTTDYWQIEDGALHKLGLVKMVDTDGDGNVDLSERYIWDGWDLVLDFVDDDLDGVAEDHELDKRYLWGPAVDQFFAQENVDDIATEGEVLWPLTDNLNTVRDLAEYDDGTDTTSVVEHFTYDAFGNITAGDITKTRRGGTVDLALALPYSGCHWQSRRAASANC